MLADEKSNIKLAKVDATIETELAEQHDVKGFPTLKFFIKENAVDYSGLYFFLFCYEPFVKPLQCNYSLYMNLGEWKHTNSET